MLRGSDYICRVPSNGVSRLDLKKRTHIDRVGSTLLVLWSDGNRQNHGSELRALDPQHRFPRTRHVWGTGRRETAGLPPRPAHPAPVRSSSQGPLLLGGPPV